MRPTRDMEKSITLTLPAALTLGLNGLCLACGLLFVPLGQPEGIVWNVFGILLLAVLTGNLFFAAAQTRLRLPATVYTIVSLVSMACLPIVNTIASLAPDAHGSQSIFSFILLFSLWGLGALMGYRRLRGERAPNKTIQPGIEVPPPRDRAGRWIGSALVTMLFLSALPFLIVLFSTDYLGIGEVFVPEYAVFSGLFYLSAAVLLTRLLPLRGFTRLRSTLLFTGAIVLLLCVAPLTTTPFFIPDAA